MEFNRKNRTQTLRIPNVNLYQKDDKGNSLLHIALSRGKLGELKTILKLAKLSPNSAKILEAKNNEGYTPLHGFVLNNSQLNDNEDIIPFLEALLDENANINAEDNDGNTPLHTAAEYANSQIVKFLIDKGANTEAKNKDGKTPLNFAEQESMNDGHDPDTLKKYREIVKIFRDLQREDHLSLNKHLVSNENLFSSPNLLQNSHFQRGAKPKRPKKKSLVPSQAFVTTAESNAFGTQELNDSLTSLGHGTGFVSNTLHTQAEVNPSNLSLTSQRGLADNQGMNNLNTGIGLVLNSKIFTSMRRKKNSDAGRYERLRDTTRIIDAIEHEPTSPNITAKSFK